ncbi:hypothetical protein ACS0TY_017449 [Phlomoides rotata]
MASLHLSSSSSSVSIHTTPSSPRRPFPKPSHFLTHARQSHRRLHLSCAAPQNQDSSSHSQNIETFQGKVDRRNMLLGLGGLYGASSLVPTPAASASPVQAPELDKCGTATNLNNNKVLDINCCPPITGNIIDYRLPPVFQMKQRQSAHRLSPENIFKYNMALDRMRRLPSDDPRSFMQQAYIHCAYCNGAYNQPGQGDLDIQVHNSWLFFPFHRWYLYFYERILGKLIGDPTFALPFWNWDNPKGMTIPPVFLDPKSALYDSKRNQDNLTAVIDLGLTGNKDTLQVVTNNLTIMYTEMVRGNADVYDFMGQPYRQGTQVNPGPGSSERGSHTAAHVFVGDPREPSGEDLGNFYSAGRDPLFYCHHSNVDRMWTIWQYFLPSNKVADKKITDPDFLNASFLFYDENAQLVRVLVKDCLDNLRMGYDYERVDLPWMDYRPPPQTARARITRAASASAPKAETLFPLTLDRVVRFEVKKTKKGKADELLVLENITVDTTKFLKFDVFVNDEDDNASELDKAAYAGSYAQVPHKTNQTATTSFRLKLTDLYDDMDIADDDSIVVTIVPRHQGPGVTIGGIKIIENPTKPAATS